MIETRAAIMTYSENRESFRLADLLSYLNSIINISKVTFSWNLIEMVKDNILFKHGREICRTHIHGMVAKPCTSETRCDTMKNTCS